MGEREIIYLSLRSHHQNDFCVKMGRDEIHFNVSVGSDGQSHKTVSTNHKLLEEKGEPKRYRTESLLVVLACESLHECIVCTWRCEQARFCVEVFIFIFLCATDKFYSIRSFASVQGEPQS